MCLHMYEYVRNFCPGLIWPTFIKGTILRKMLPVSLLYWEQVKLLLGGMLLFVGVFSKLLLWFETRTNRLYGMYIVTLWRVSLVIMPPTVLTAWFYFSLTEWYYGDLTSPATIKRTYAFMWSPILFSEFKQIWILSTHLSKVPNIKFRANPPRWYTPLDRQVDAQDEINRRVLRLRQGWGVGGVCSFPRGFLLHVHCLTCVRSLSGVRMLFAWIYTK